MKNVLEEIRYLRGNKDFTIDRCNQNRHCVLVAENGGKTSYYFSAPLYHCTTKKLVTPKIWKTSDGYEIRGTNGTVKIEDRSLIFENQDGKVIVEMMNTNIRANQNLYATLNGAYFRLSQREIRFIVRIESDKEKSVLFNAKCLAWMKGTFTPFFSVAAMYAQTHQGELLPICIEWNQHEKNTVEGRILGTEDTEFLCFEANLYEPKLFQDTTVEQKSPDQNNVYAPIGFVGNTEQLGKQWLYSRPDIFQISEESSGLVEQARLYIPKFYGNAEDLKLYVPQKRFCSFGTTWNNQVDQMEKKCSIRENERYLSIDVTNLFSDSKYHFLIANEGMILKGSSPNHYVAIATADCYSHPQILEIQWKNKKTRN
ncbi:MAG: DNRLRE domain-containing protein [Clostridia bacterium]|nr:DNRLRE domain-containing protein [Clostridia bacterium]